MDFYDKLGLPCVDSNPLVKKYSFELVEFNEDNEHTPIEVKYDF